MENTNTVGICDNKCGEIESCQYKNNCKYSDKIYPRCKGRLFDKDPNVFYSVFDKKSWEITEKPYIGYSTISDDMIMGFFDVCFHTLLRKVKHCKTTIDSNNKNERFYNLDCIQLLVNDIDRQLLYIVKHFTFADNNLTQNYYAWSVHRNPHLIKESSDMSIDELADIIVYGIAYFQDIINKLKKDPYETKVIYDKRDAVARVIISVTSMLFYARSYIYMHQGHFLMV